VAAAHLAEHGISEFELDRHVHRGGPRLPSQHLVWNPAKATFDCDLCDTIVSTGEITKEMLWSTQLFDEALKPFLAGRFTEAERDEITRRYLSGELADSVLQASRRTARRRKPKQPRPTVDHRKARVQKWMLERFMEHGVVERVVEEALRMQREQPQAWALICDKPRAPSTLRRDWQQIDHARVEAAKTAYTRRRN